MKVKYNIKNKLITQMKGGIFLKKHVEKKMTKKNSISKIGAFNSLITIGIFAFTIILIYTGTYINQKYNIAVGSISPERFVANVEVVNKIATDKKIEEAKATVKPLYKQDIDITKEVIEQINIFFENIKEAKRLEENEKLKKAKVTQSIQQANEDQEQSQSSQEVQIFIEEPETSKTDEIQTVFNNKTPVFLSSEKLNTLMALDYNHLEALEEKIIAILGEILEAGVKEETLTKSIMDAKDEIYQLEWENNVKDIAYSIVSSVIEPNLIVDDEATQQAINTKVSEVKPIVIMKGQKIIDKDEIVTEEIYSILESLNIIQKNEWETKNIIPIVGLFIIIMLIQIIVYEYIRNNNKKLWADSKQKLMLFTMYCLIVLLIRATTALPYVVIPIALFGMLVAMLIDLQLAVLLNIVISIIATLIYGGDLQFLLYFIVSGTFSCILTKFTYERSNTVKALTLISLINGIVVIGIGFLFEKNITDQLLIRALYGMLSGLIALIVMTGSLPFWEAAFEAVTPIKLLELTNPNQPILKRLITEAPGTYHHSIIVANLSEMAAMDIGADGALARAGSYYHDIGKLKYPNYFSENQVGENPHDYLLPLDSAKIIIDHVQIGHAYAMEQKLPKVVRDIIIQHQGTTMVKYFYFKAKKELPTEDIKQEQYRYPGIIPQFKEAAIVMLADTVEAAVRSMMSKGKTMDEINIFIGDLIKDKLNDGQLLDSGLTIKDLSTIQKSFINVFKGMYHERIVYPKEAIKDGKVEVDKEK